VLLPELPFQFVCETGGRVYTVTHWCGDGLVVNWVDGSGAIENTVYNPVDVLKLFLEGDWILLPHKEVVTEVSTEVEELEARIETLEGYITQLVRENKKLKEDAIGVVRILIAKGML
jgi:hypothetical protein